jgi:pyridoxal phosphate enzyme (YggS family)
MGLAENLAGIRAEIAAACARRGRDASAVRLIAVTKAQDAAALPQLASAGVQDVGENRMDHLARMQDAAPAGMRFHAIGRLQGRVIPEVARRCVALHSLCEADHVERLDRACLGRAEPLEVFLQVNIRGESSKAGVAPDALPALLARAQGRSFRLVGLMTMAPAPESGGTERIARACFRTLTELAAHHGLPRLSMGMSQDFPIAVQEGATDIRVGTRLFA